MDNAGDWLYIVFLAIAGISSLFSSKNKKKRPKQILGQPDKDIVTSEKEVPAKGFWEILEEMQKPEPVKQPAAAPKPFLAGEKMADRQSSARNRIAAPPAEEESPLTEIEFDNAAELRKAVIYAEILNRKY